MHMSSDTGPADQESSRYNAAAMDFFAVNRGRTERSNRTARPAANWERARNPLPPQSSFQQMQLGTPRPQSLVSDQIEPRIVPVEPGPDTAAKRNSDPRQAMGNEYEKLQDSEARIPTQNTIGNKEKDKQRSDKEKDKRRNDPRVGGSCPTSNKVDEEAIPRAHERWDYSSASDTEVAEGNSGTGILNKIQHMAFNAFRDLYKSRLEEQISKQECTITALEKKNKRRERRIEALTQHVSVLQDHSTQMEEKYKDATARLQKANASAAELRDDIVRLSNALPGRTNDDQYFKTRFVDVFYSLEGWVLTYFMNAKLDSSTLSSLPEELIRGLYGLLGQEWATFAAQETVRTMEAVVVRVIQNVILEPRVLGIVGNSFSEIEKHFGACTVNAINAWRMQTSKMIISSPEFPAMVQKQVGRTADYIEHLLGPLAGGKRDGRMRRLKAIIQQAADLALECNKEPSSFTYTSYGPGWACQSNCMTDALRSVDDEHVGEGGACVRLVVSPAVMRTPENPNDEPIIIMKARVVRGTRPLADKAECASTRNSKYGVITAT